MQKSAYGKPAITAIAIAQSSSSCSSFSITPSYVNRDETLLREPVADKKQRNYGHGKYSGIDIKDYGGHRFLQNDMRHIPEPAISARPMNASPNAEAISSSGQLITGTS